MLIKRCGTCHFARINPQIAAQDLSKRVCFGAPPTPFHMPAGPGQFRMQMIRSVVSVTEDACSFHKTKDEVDRQTDEEGMKVAQQIRLMSGQANSETKQQ
jgi:hypothetical protein